MDTKIKCITSIAGKLQYMQGREQSQGASNCASQIIPDGFICIYKDEISPSAFASNSKQCQGQTGKLSLQLSR